jgi:hypothetical protein
MGLKQDAHARKHWEGQYWGPNGAMREGLFKFLSTLYSSYKSAPTWRHKALVVLSVAVLFVVIRCGYTVKDHSVSELDVLASVANQLGFRRFAIRCGEAALSRNEENFTERMLLLAGLMRSHASPFHRKAATPLQQKYFSELAESFDDGEYDPPEQKIRILRALAWFTDVHGEADKLQTRLCVAYACSIAQHLGARDQYEAIRREFPHIVK